MLNDQSAGELFKVDRFMAPIDGVETLSIAHFGLLSLHAQH